MVSGLVRFEGYSVLGLKGLHLSLLRDLEETIPAPEGSENFGDVRGRREKELRFEKRGRFGTEEDGIRFVAATEKFEDWYVLR